MIYVQPQISCTLPLKLFVRSKHLIDSDIIEKKDRRTISRPCQHKIKHYAEYTHTHTHILGESKCMFQSISKAYA